MMATEAVHYIPNDFMQLSEISIEEELHFCENCFSRKWPIIGLCNSILGEKRVQLCSNCLENAKWVAEFYFGKNYRWTRRVECV